MGYVESHPAVARVVKGLRSSDAEIAFQIVFRFPEEGVGSIFMLC